MAVKFGEGVLAGPHADFLAQSWGSTVSLKGGIVPLWAFSSRSSRVNTDYTAAERERERSRGMTEGATARIYEGEEEVEEEAC